jgi:hypothetical protein
VVPRDCVLRYYVIRDSRSKGIASELILKTVAVALHNPLARKHQTVKLGDAGPAQKDSMAAIQLPDAFFASQVVDVGGCAFFQVGLC